MRMERVKSKGSPRVKEGGTQGGRAVDGKSCSGR